MFYRVIGRVANSFEEPLEATYVCWRVERFRVAYAALGEENVEDECVRHSDALRLDIATDILLPWEFVWTGFEKREEACGFVLYVLVRR